MRALRRPIRALRRERGAIAVEYVALIAVVVAVLGVVVASSTGIGEAISGRIVALIQGIGEGSGGGARDGQQGGGGSPAGQGAGPAGAPAPAAPNEDDGGGNVFTGAWEGLKDVGGELGDTAVGIGRHVNVFDLDATGEQWRRTAATAEHIVTHPWESTKAVASSFWDPIAESYERGGLDEALGRGVVTGAGAVVGGKGLTKLGRAGRVDAAGPEAPDTPDAAARRSQAERANCVSNSFAATTPILMASGERRAIARVGVGERVLATDPRSGETGARAVERVIVGEGRKTLVRVRVSGDVITATDRHPFWVESREAWVDAEDLRTGDVLREQDGQQAPVESVMVLAPEPERVYNLTVTGLHTYYVGEAPVLVHNAGCDPDLSTTRRDNHAPTGAGRRGAFGEAKRQNGIPVSQQPSRVGPNTDRRGNRQPGRTYEFDLPAQGGGTQVKRLRDDAAGSYFGPGDPENRGPHFNDEAGRHFDYGG